MISDWLRHGHVQEKHWIVNAVSDFLDEIQWGVSSARAEATKVYSIETSTLIVLQGDDGNGSYANMWAIFDVSATTLTRYIAVHWEKSHPNERYWNSRILVIFDSVPDLLLWCARLQELDRAEFRTGMLQRKYQNTEWLDELCQAEGWEDWKHYVNQMLAQKKGEYPEDTPMASSLYCDPPDMPDLG
jgi:hypothetical protein